MFIPLSDVDKQGMNYHIKHDQNTDGKDCITFLLSSLGEYLLITKLRYLYFSSFTLALKYTRSFPCCFESLDKIVSNS